MYAELSGSIRLFQMSFEEKKENNRTIQLSDNVKTSPHMLFCFATMAAAQSPLTTHRAPYAGTHRYTHTPYPHVATALKQIL